ncbi:MAG: FkbM family methyltransferase [Hyphomicrobium sp.]
MANLRGFVTSHEDKVPGLFNQLRYLLHVKARGHVVYPQLTKALFEIIGATGKQAVDVGANVGIFTRYLSYHFAKVHAIEPLPDLAMRLNHINSRKVIVHQCAVGSADGEITIRTPLARDGRPMHALTTASAKNDLKLFDSFGMKEVVVPQRRLSNILAGRGDVAFVKIDVEGFEQEAMVGAREMIESNRPVLLIEIGRAHNPEYKCFLQLLNDLGYAAFSVRKHGLTDDVLACIEAQPVAQGAVEIDQDADIFDFMFLPKEQLGRFKPLIKNAP